jgi:DegV family protein with EDD domain
MVKIITDSLSDISPAKAKELGITVVPLNIHFADKLYKDSIDLSPDEFYQKLTGSKIFPSTSAPAPGLFLELYESLAKESKEIIAIMASNKISAVQESAIQAKAMFKGDCRIEIINTEQLIGAEAILVYLALEAAKKGANLDQITDLVKKAIPRVHSRMVFDTLEYLEKGGRIGKAKALVGGLLKIHPMLGLKDGQVHPFRNARNRAQAIDLLVSFVKEFKKVEMVVIEHATTPEELDLLADRLNAFFPKERMIRSRVGPVIGTHTGPHVLSVCVLEGE